MAQSPCVDIALGEPIGRGQFDQSSLFLIGLRGMNRPPSPPQNFESAVAELDEIVRRMEDGRLPLEQSLEAYRRGTELLKFCQQALQDAEQQVRILSEQNELKDFSISSDD